MIDIPSFLAGFGFLWVAVGMLLVAGRVIIWRRVWPGDPLWAVTCLAIWWLCCWPGIVVRSGMGR